MDTSRNPLRETAPLRPAAVWFPSAGRVEFRDEEVPAPGKGEIRVETTVSAISHGTEMLVYRGQVPPDLDLDLPALRGSFSFPIKYGYAVVGRVVASGEDAQLREGVQVFVHHPHQTEFVTPVSSAIRVDGIEAESAVFAANLETAVNVVLDARVRAGDRVAVFGQGVVGLLVTKLLKRSGAASVVGVEPAALRKQMSKRAGADIVCDPEEALGAIMELTSGSGADIVIEASGNPAALDPAMQCAGFQARVVVCSWYGAKPVTLDLGGAFHRRRLRLISSQVGHVDPELGPMWNRDRRTAFVEELLSELDLQSLVTHRFPFSEAAAAYALVDSSPEETVQVLLTYEKDSIGV